jgi:hypothetical protein
LRFLAVRFRLSLLVTVAVVVAVAAAACSDPRDDLGAALDGPAGERGADGGALIGTADRPQVSDAADTSEGPPESPDGVGLPPLDAIADGPLEAAPPVTAEEHAFGCPADAELRACYTFDDFGPAGTALLDGSGRHNDGSRMLAGTRMGVRGKALLFTTEQFALVPDSPSLRLSGARATFEAWILPSKFTVEGNADFLAGKFTRASVGYLFGLNSGMVSIFQNGQTGRSSVSVVPLNVWSHVAAVLTPAGVALYINGQRTKVALDPALVLTPNEEPLTIGNRDPATSDRPPANTAYFGAIDVLRIWGRARTPAEICLDAFGKWNGTACANSSMGLPPE